MTHSQPILSSSTKTSLLKRNDPFTIVFNLDRLIFCNGPSPPLTNIVSLSFSFRVVSFSSPSNVGSHNPPPSAPNVLTGTLSILQSTWDPPIHPLTSTMFLLAHRLVSTFLQGSDSSLAHCRVFGLDTICNSPSLPLTDIVLFELSLLDFLSRFLKHVC